MPEAAPFGAPVAVAYAHSVPSTELLWGAEELVPIHSTLPGPAVADTGVKPVAPEKKTPVKTWP